VKFKVTDLRFKANEESKIPKDSNITNYA